MSRYIDAEKFADKIYDVWQLAEKKGDTSLVYAFAEVVTPALISTPTEDVEEVKHGRWVTLGDFEMCSVCTCTKLKEFDATYGKAIWVRSKYCPTCGAKMDL